MIPAYVLTAGFLVAAWLRTWATTERKRSKFRTVILAILGVIGLLIALALPFLLPVSNLPEPSGPYAVGTTTYHIIDENRVEIYDEGEIRFVKIGDLIRK